MVKGIHNLAIQFIPSAAGKAYRKLGGLANRMWMTHFNTEEALKGDHRAIFEKLEAMYLERGEKLQTSQQKLHAAEVEISQLRQEVKKKQRDINVLNSQVDHLKALKLTTMFDGNPPKKNKKKGSGKTGTPASVGARGKRGLLRPSSAASSLRSEDIARRPSRNSMRSVQR